MFQQKKIIITITTLVTVDDAIAIYTKYLTKETAYDIGASESIRNDVVGKKRNSSF